MAQMPADGKTAPTGTPNSSQHAEAGSISTPSFEVASIRLDPPNFSGLSDIHNTGAIFIASHVTFKLLVGIAYGISDDHILGGPKWLESQRYCVNAKVEGDRLLTAKEMQPLLRRLLQDRFHLAVHHETKEGQGYGLVVVKNGANLQAAAGDSQMGYIFRDTLRFPSITLDNFAGVLARVIGRPVVDKTGIKGSYNIRLQYAPSDATDSAYPSIFTALQEQLGLKLEPQKVPDETLVIDSVEREPTEN